jgi:hypothetical protein
MAILPAGAALGVTETVSFQDGIGGYTGTELRRIDERAGAQDYNGDDRVRAFVDGYQLDPRSQESQVLLRFENIIGNGAGQIPPGATILDAALTVRTGTAGASDSPGPWGVAQLLQPFDQTTSFFGSFNCGGCTLVSRGAWWEDGYTERPLAGFGRQNHDQVTSADVRDMVQAWSDNAASNHGLVIQAGNPPGTVDGWGFESTGHPVASSRPKLSVTYTTDPIEFNTFQRGLNGYAGDTMALVQSGTNIFGITGGEPDPGRDDITFDGATGSFTVAPNSTITAPAPLTSFQEFLDGIAFGDTNIDGTASSPDTFALIKFDNLFGAGAGQAPQDVPVARAWLGISTGTESNASPSTGEWSVHKVLTQWDTTTLYSEIGDTPGLQVEDGEIGTPLDIQIGIIYGSEVWFDVTDYVEGIRNGESDLGLAIRAFTDDDGWEIHLNGSPDQALRPRLVVASGNPAVVGLDGDYNGDGSVDAADYVVWRKTMGSQSGYDLWRANFGRTAGGGGPFGSGAGSAVPEPGALAIGLLAFVALAVIRARKQ